MAVPTLIPGHKFWLYLGSTDATPVYAKVCGLTSTELNAERSVLEAEVRGCAEGDSDEPVMVRKPSTKTWSISGTVKYNKAGFELLYAAIMDATDSRYWKIVGKTNNESWVGQFTGSAIGLSATAEGAEFATATITLASDGAITFTAGV